MTAPTDYQQCRGVSRKKGKRESFKACGWPSALSDEEIRERLLARKLERSTSAKILPVSPG
jgi:hypothetical protein